MLQHLQVMSGHMFNDNYFGFDDALYATVDFVNMMTNLIESYQVL